MNSHKDQPRLPIFRWVIILLKIRIDFLLPVSGNAFEVNDLLLL